MGPAGGLGAPRHRRGSSLPARAASVLRGRRASPSAMLPGFQSHTPAGECSTTLPPLGPVHDLSQVWIRYPVTTAHCIQCGHGYISPAAPLVTLVTSRPVTVVRSTVNEPRYQGLKPKRNTKIKTEVRKQKKTKKRKASPSPWEGQLQRSAA